MKNIFTQNEIKIPTKSHKYIYTYRKERKKMTFWAVDVIWFLKKEGLVLNTLLKPEVPPWTWWMLLSFADTLYSTPSISNFAPFILSVTRPKAAPM